MNNYKQKNAVKGKELLIKNYSCSLPKDKENKVEQLAMDALQNMHPIPNDILNTIKEQNIIIEDS